MPTKKRNDAFKTISAEVSVYLNELLAAEARKQKVSKSEVIRKALFAYLSE